MDLRRAASSLPRLLPAAGVEKLMLSRSSAIIVSVTSLITGIVLGIVLARGGPVVSAQVAGRAQSENAVSEAARQEAGVRSRQEQADEVLYEALAKQYDQFQQINRTFELVAKAVSPTVVHIVAEKVTRPEFDAARRPRHFEETGSGVIIRSNRGPGLYVLTNHHVVDGSKPSSIRVRLHDGRSILPIRVWNYAQADVAVLQLDRDDLPAARVGNSDEARVGTWVMALGSPFGLMHSVSQGIISARSRQLEELPDMLYQDFLQTDAAINPGNSGGPLVNMKGEVIGINNSIASNGGGNEGVGFSIPINLARWIMNELIAHGRVTWGALGVDLKPRFLETDANALGMDKPRGAWIDQVHVPSPAAQAGIHDGDVVLRFAGVDIIDLNHLINMVSMTTVGQTADVVVWRDRREHRLTVTVGERERTLNQATVATGAGRDRDPSTLLRRPNRPGGGSSYVLGLELATLNPELAKRIEFPESWRGALVLSVDGQSPLSRLVKQGDVISVIDDEVIQTAEQTVKILNGRADHVQLVMGLDRMNQGKMERHTVRVP
jgi:serine protease Do